MGRRRAAGGSSPEVMHEVVPRADPAERHDTEDDAHGDRDDHQDGAGPGATETRGHRAAPFLPVGGRERLGGTLARPSKSCLALSYVTCSMWTHVASLRPHAPGYDQRSHVL